MPCFNPLQAWPNPAGGKVLWSPHRSWEGAQPLTIPCGQCIGCRMTRADEWATRLWHEAQTHERSAFLTLTFSDEHLPEDGSIRVRDVQLFIKRLRKHLGHNRVRFFACGEYGGAGNRPHYHAIIYGYDFPDRQPWRKSDSGFVCYRSEILERLWPCGFAELGTVTRESLGYVARYVLKKVNGPAAEEHYLRANPVTGEVHRVAPEFITMSTKPGIGAEWYTRFKTDAFPSDFVIVDGKKKPVPRYYKKQLEIGEDLRVSSKRQVKAKKHADNQTPDRLAIREEVQERRAERLKRTI